MIPTFEFVKQFETVWVTSDTHLQHEKVIEFETLKRPFKSINEHDFTLLARHNEVVSDDDLVIHLGDVSWTTAGLEYINLCKGTKILVGGNHDKFHVSDYLKVFYDVRASLIINRYLLTHIPIHPQCKRRSWAGNIHGHLHNERIMHQRPLIADQWVEENDPYYKCVSLEHTDLYPVMLKDVIKGMHVRV